MLEDNIYFDFFMNGEHFTVEDYTKDAAAVFCEDSFVAVFCEDSFVAVFCEDSFVAEIAAPDPDLAYAAARDFLGSKELFDQHDWSE